MAVDADRVNVRPFDLRRKLQCAALASLGLSIAGLAISSFASANSTPLNLQSQSAAPLVSTRAVPTYFADAPNWAKTKAQAGGISYVIMNPNSGPGAALDPAWVARLAEFGSAPEMLGYVATTYSARPIADVEADIAKYMQWYGVKSIFLDETPWGCSQTEYYESLAATIRANGGIVIMNPGGLPLNCMIDIPDIVVSFENNAQAYLSSTATNPPGYAPQKFWHLIYAAPANQISQLEELARQRGAGYIYVTSDDLPNPWDSIETFASSPVTDPTVIPHEVTTTTTTVPVTTVPASTVPASSTTTTLSPPTTTLPVTTVSPTTTTIAVPVTTTTEPSTTTSPTTVPTTIPTRIAAPGAPEEPVSTASVPQERSSVPGSQAPSPQMPTRGPAS